MCSSDLTASDTGSEWTCMNSLLLWKEMTWCLKKACASQLNQESIFQVKSVSVSKIVGTSQKTDLDSSLKPAKTYFTLTNPLVVSIYNKHLVSLITIKNEAGTKVLAS